MAHLHLLGMGAECEVDHGAVDNFNNIECEFSCNSTKTHISHPAIVNNVSKY